MERKRRRVAVAVAFRIGSRSRTRTYDKAVNSRLLYQLSYPGSAGGPYSEGRGDWKAPPPCDDGG